jgi:pyruvate kinase
MLDTKGPEIRTGKLERGSCTYIAGSEIILTTDYEVSGNALRLAVSYAALPRDVQPGGSILIADGSLTLTVLSCDKAAGTVRARCENTATIGERKNVNLPGVVVDLPTLTEKDEDDLIDWGVKNEIDFVAASALASNGLGSNALTVLYRLCAQGKRRCRDSQCDKVSHGNRSQPDAHNFQDRKSRRDKEL